jgi:hypothetical protein
MALPYVGQGLAAGAGSGENFWWRGSAAHRACRILKNSARRSLGPIDLFVETFVGLWFVANETFLGH